MGCLSGVEVLEKVVVLFSPMSVLAIHDSTFEKLLTARGHGAWWAVR